MTELRYNSMEFRLPIEYFPIFYRNHKPSPWAVLKCFSRREMLNLVLVLGNKYVNQPAMNILYLMADNNWWKRYTYFRWVIIWKGINLMIKNISYAFHKHCWKYFVILFQCLLLLVLCMNIIKID